MAAFNKKKFLAKLGIKNRKKVTLPDGELYIKALTAMEQEEFESAILGADGKAKTDVSLKAIMVIMSAEDEEGNKVFTMDDLKTLGEMPAADINKMFNEAQKLNNISDADIDELTKN